MNKVSTLYYIFGSKLYRLNEWNSKANLNVWQTNLSLDKERPIVFQNLEFGKEDLEALVAIEKFARESCRKFHVWPDSNLHLVYEAFSSPTTLAQKLQSQGYSKEEIEVFQKAAQILNELGTKKLINVMSDLAKNHKYPFQKENVRSAMNDIAKNTGQLVPVSYYQGYFPGLSAEYDEGGCLAVFSGEQLIGTASPKFTGNDRYSEGAPYWDIILKINDKEAKCLNISPYFSTWSGEIATKVDHQVRKILGETGLFRYHGYRE